MANTYDHKFGVKGFYDPNGIYSENTYGTFVHEQIMEQARIYEEIEKESPTDGMAPFQAAEHELQIDLESMGISKEPEDPKALRNKLRVAKAERIHASLARINKSPKNTYNPTAGACYGNGRKDQFKNL